MTYEKPSFIYVCASMDWDKLVLIVNDSCVSTKPGADVSLNPALILISLRLGLLNSLLQFGHIPPYTLITSVGVGSP